MAAIPPNLIQLNHNALAQGARWVPCIGRLHVVDSKYQKSAGKREGVR
jgi:hypothetical protein